jgi:hypothetical protein
MGMMTETQTITLFDLSVQNKRCPDYDEDCLTFNKEEAFSCWIGWENIIDGKTYYCDQAEGYCPIIHGED